MWNDILASSIVMLVFVFLMLGIYYLISARGLKKRKEHFAKLHTELTSGQYVSFSNGLYGTIVAVRKDTVDIKVKSGAVMTVSRYAISELVEETSLT